MAGYDFDTRIDRLGTGSSKWSKYRPDVLPMWVADMDFAAAPEIMAALRQRLEHPVLGYSVARDALREQVVGDMAGKYGWSITPEDIVFLPGIEAGFNMALKAMLTPGDGVLVQTPMYRPVLNAPAHWGLRRIDLDLAAGADGRYRTDLEQFDAALRGARAFLFCNPHNPTGKVFERREVEALASLCASRDALIISDEIHCDLLFDGRTHTPTAALSPEIADRTVTLMAASKTYNIAGLKTGFAIIQNRSMREKINAARMGMVDSVNFMGLEATLAAYRDAGAWKDAAIAYLQANRDYLADALARRLPEMRMTRPEGTFLAWLDCKDLALPTDPYSFFLEHAKIGFSAGSDFGAAYGDYVRLNFGCSRATLEEAITRLEAAVRGR